jgi:hypothetical protein
MDTNNNFSSGMTGIFHPIPQIIAEHNTPTEIVKSTPAEYKTII